MTVWSSFCLPMEGGINDEVYLERGSLIFEPPLCLQAADEVGQPFHEFMAFSNRNIILAVTGLDLCDTWGMEPDDHGAIMENNEVLEVAARLERFLENAKPDTQIFDKIYLHDQAEEIPRQRIQDLARLFRTYGDLGYVLVTA